MKKAKIFEGRYVERKELKFDSPIICNDPQLGTIELVGITKIGNAFKAFDAWNNEYTITKLPLDTQELLNKQQFLWNNKFVAGV